jgi:hypothetical protein
LPDEGNVAEKNNLPQNVNPRLPPDKRHAEMIVDPEWRFFEVEKQSDGSGRLFGETISKSDVDIVYAERRKVREQIQRVVDKEQVAVLVNDHLAKAGVAGISAAFPFVGGEVYHLDLEHGRTRTNLGYLQGRKLCNVKRGACRKKPAGLCEYACVMLLGTDALVIEFVKLAQRPGRVTVTLNGELLAEMVTTPDGHPFGIEEPREVYIGSELFGTINGRMGWRDSPFFLVRPDGRKLPIPLQFGHTTMEVLNIMWRIVTLAPLWSSMIPENTSYIVDPETALLLDEREQIIYFAVSLYYLASVHNSIIAGG